MLVFKFGGASVKDAGGIINLASVVKKYTGNQLLIVVSAMGKTTNALESLTRAYVDQSDNMHLIYEGIKQYHFDILHELFEPKHSVFDEIANTFVEIDWMIEDEPQDDYDFIYDQLVSIGELVSTRIISAYLNKEDLKNQWLDVRGYIHTDNTYREGVVQWDKTCESITRDIPALLDKGIVVTQGFLGGTSENFTTTLGREGSDYTASIFAACLNAQSVTTWKDVPGILNADPKFFTDTVKFDELSYSEAIEMTYYGASVIHPKTIKPLQNAHIPLLVKPFTDPSAPGTVIKEDGVNTFVKPVIILKQNQVLLSVSSKDYSFVTEDHLSDIFGLFAQNQVKVNVMQTSALSFSVCFDFYEERFEKLLNSLQQNFKVKYNTGLTLITIRHHAENALKELTQGKTVLLEQVSRNTAQVVVK
ncbi:aspartate kinase [Mucilaginibacter lappiensis]|uniref:Aspartokinase n=1 Tax=Mucilaginibacter lappiensis TaxID=354630 RepID=A0ABR6PJI0_9SPHI|nr:aspartate kinase [Mucilaginibacter lappiensis]MBB6109140.1 aspartate kinase [Mucilaginibacter lappiensis]SIQ77194.1 aspartate kinase [Mucilaginibacter lappiensis]